MSTIQRQFLGTADDARSFIDWLVKTAPQPPADTGGRAPMAVYTDLPNDGAVIEFFMNRRVYVIQKDDVALFNDGAFEVRRLENMYGS